MAKRNYRIVIALTADRDQYPADLQTAMQRYLDGNDCGWLASVEDVEDCGQAEEDEEEGQ